MGKSKSKGEFNVKPSIGDIVKLISGSPEMTVMSTTDTHSTVVWYMGDDCSSTYTASTFQTATMPHECLTLVRLNPARVN